MCITAWGYLLLSKITVHSVEMEGTEWSELPPIWCFTEIIQFCIYITVAPCLLLHSYMHFNLHLFSLTFWLIYSTWSNNMAQPWSSVREKALNLDKSIRHDVHWNSDLPYVQQWIQATTSYDMHATSCTYSHNKNETRRSSRYVHKALSMENGFCWSLSQWSSEEVSTVRLC